MLNTLSRKGLLIKAAQKGKFKSLLPDLTIKTDNTSIANSYKYHPETKGEAVSRKRKDKIKEDKFQKEVDKKWKSVQNSSFSTVNYKDRKQLETVMRKQLGMRKEWDDKSVIDKTETITGEALLAFAPEFALGKLGKVRKVAMLVDREPTEKDIEGIMKALKSNKKVDLFEGRKILKDNPAINITKEEAERNVRKNKEEAKKLINKLSEFSRKDYFDKMSHPDNLKKYARLDAETTNGLNVKSVSKWIENNDYNSPEYLKIRDKIVFDDLKMGGLSRYDISLDDYYKYVLKYLQEKNIINEDAVRSKLIDIYNGDKDFNDWIMFLQQEYLSNGLDPIKREVLINSKDAVKGYESLSWLINHELKHNINSAGAYISREYRNELSSVFKDNGINKGIDKINNLSDFEYFTSPTEFMSYAGTNLKDELVDLGLINAVHDKITPSILKQADIKGSKIYNIYKPYITDTRKFLNILNKTPYMATGVATLYGANKVKAKQKGGLSEVERKKENISDFYEDYPALINAGKINIYPDKEYRAKEYGFGDIEFMDRDKVTYSDDYSYNNPFKGEKTIVYNPDAFDGPGEINQAIFLDAVSHGMKSDPKYKMLYDRFSKAYMDSPYKGDIERDWKNESKKHSVNDGYEHFKENYIDGVIRNLMFEGSEEDFKKARYWKDIKNEIFSQKDIYDSYNAIRKYLKTNKW